MSYRLSLWDPTLPAEEMLFDVPFEGTQEEGFLELQKTVDSGKARLGQLLAEDGLVLKTYARPSN